MRVLTAFRLMFALVLVGGLFVLGAGRALAGGATITDHVVECFTGVGSDIFEECHDDVETDTVQIDKGATSATLTLSDLTGYVGAYVYCRDLVDDEVLFDGSYADGVTIPLEDDDDIVCDIYLLKAGGGSGDDDDDDGNGGGVTQLPSTGSGPFSSESQLPLYLALITTGLAALGLQLRRSMR